MDALETETRKEVQNVSKCPKWNSDNQQRFAFELMRMRLHNNTARRCGANLMAKILISTVPESKKIPYTELPMIIGCTY